MNIFARIKEFFAGGGSHEDGHGGRKPPISAVTSWAVAHGVPGSVLDDHDEDSHDKKG